MSDDYNWVGVGQENFPSSHREKTAYGKIRRVSLMLIDRRFPVFIFCLSNPLNGSSPRRKGISQQRNVKFHRMVLGKAAERSALEKWPKTSLKCSIKSLVFSRGYNVENGLAEKQCFRPGPYSVPNSCGQTPLRNREHQFPLTHYFSSTFSNPVELYVPLLGNTQNLTGQNILV